MTKCALSAVVGVLAFSLSVSAQEQTQRPDFFRTLNGSSLHFPSLTLSERSLFTFSSTFNWVQPTLDVSLPADVTLPTIVVTAPRRSTASTSVSYLQDSSKEVVDVRRPNLFDYDAGEEGVLYGRSSGKFGREFEQGYFVGEVGNDKFQISAGASYENSSGRVQRFGR